jgi:hypothetical protein
MEYHQIELPAFPGVPLAAPLLVDEGRLYFPIGAVCLALDVDDKTQRVKLRRDYDECLAELRLPTVKGERPMLCIEFEALGAWVSTIQDLRVGEAQRERVRAFRKQVWRAASAILMGVHQPLTLPVPEGRRGELAGLRSLALQTEERVERLERIVFVPEREDNPTDVGEARVTCPSCGFSFGVRLAPILP